MCKMHNIICIARALVNVESYMAVSVDIFWVIKSKGGKLACLFMVMGKSNKWVLVSCEFTEQVKMGF